MFHSPARMGRVSSPSRVELYEQLQEAHFKLGQAIGQRETVSRKLSNLSSDSEDASKVSATLRVVEAVVVHWEVQVEALEREYVPRFDTSVAVDAAPPKVAPAERNQHHSPCRPPLTPSAKLNSAATTQLASSMSPATKEGRRQRIKEVGADKLHYCTTSHLSSALTAAVPGGSSPSPPTSPTSPILSNDSSSLLSRQRSSPLFASPILTPVASSSRQAKSVKDVVKRTAFLWRSKDKLPVSLMPRVKEWARTAKVVVAERTADTQLRTFKLRLVFSKLKFVGLRLGKARHYHEHRFMRRAFFAFRGVVMQNLQIKRHAIMRMKGAKAQDTVFRCFQSWRAFVQLVKQLAIMQPSEESHQQPAVGDTAGRDTATPLLLSDDSGSPSSLDVADLFALIRGSSQQCSDSNTADARNKLTAMLDEMYRRETRAASGNSPFSNKGDDGHSPDGTKEHFHIVPPELLLQPLHGAEAQSNPLSFNKMGSSGDVDVPMSITVEGEVLGSADVTQRRQRGSSSPSPAALGGGSFGAQVETQFFTPITSTGVAGSQHQLLQASFASSSALLQPLSSTSPQNSGMLSLSDRDGMMLLSPSDRMRLMLEQKKKEAATTKGKQVDGKTSGHEKQRQRKKLKGTPTATSNMERAATPNFLSVVTSRRGSSASSRSRSRSPSPSGADDQSSSSRADSTLFQDLSNYHLPLSRKEKMQGMSFAFGITASRMFTHWDAQVVANSAMQHWQENVMMKLRDRLRKRKAWHGWRTFVSQEANGRVQQEAADALHEKFLTRQCVAIWKLKHLAVMVTQRPHRFWVKLCFNAWRWDYEFERDQRRFAKHVKTTEEKVLKREVLRYWCLRALHSKNVLSVQQNKQILARAGRTDFANAIGFDESNPTSANTSTAASFASNRGRSFTNKQGGGSHAAGNRRHVATSGHNARLMLMFSVYTWLQDRPRSKLVESFMRLKLYAHWRRFIRVVKKRDPDAIERAIDPTFPEKVRQETIVEPNFGSTDDPNASAKDITAKNERVTILREDFDQGSADDAQQGERDTFGLTFEEAATMYQLFHGFQLYPEDCGFTERDIETQSTLRAERRRAKQEEERVCEQLGHQPITTATPLSAAATKYLENKADAAIIDFSFLLKWADPHHDGAMTDDTAMREDVNFFAETPFEPLRITPQSIWRNRPNQHPRAQRHGSRKFPRSSFRSDASAAFSPQPSQHQHQHWLGEGATPKGSRITRGGSIHSIDRERSGSFRKGSMLEASGTPMLRDGRRGSGLSFHTMPLNRMRTGSLASSHLNQSTSQFASPMSLSRVMSPSGRTPNNQDRRKNSYFRPITSPVQEARTAGMMSPTQRRLVLSPTADDHHHEPSDNFDRPLSPNSPSGASLSSSMGKHTSKSGKQQQKGTGSAESSELDPQEIQRQRDVYFATHWLRFDPERITIELLQQEEDQPSTALSQGGHDGPPMALQSHLSLGAQTVVSNSSSVMHTPRSSLSMDMVPLPDALLTESVTTDPLQRRGSATSSKKQEQQFSVGSSDALRSSDHLQCVSEGSHSDMDEDDDRSSAEPAEEQQLQTMQDLIEEEFQAAVAERNVQRVESDERIHNVSCRFAALRLARVMSTFSMDASSIVEYRGMTPRKRKRKKKQRGVVRTSFTPRQRKTTTPSRSASPRQEAAPAPAEEPTKTEPQSFVFEIPQLAEQNTKTPPFVEPPPPVEEPPQPTPHPNNPADDSVRPEVEAYPPSHRRETVVPTVCEEVKGAEPPSTSPSPPPAAPLDAAAVFVTQNEEAPLFTMPDAGMPRVQSWCETNPSGSRSAAPTPVAGSPLKDGKTSPNILGKSCEEELHTSAKKDTVKKQEDGTEPEDHVSTSTAAEPSPFVARLKAFKRPDPYIPRSKAMIYRGLLMDDTKEKEKADDEAEDTGRQDSARFTSASDVCDEEMDPLPFCSVAQLRKVAKTYSWSKASRTTSACNTVDLLGNKSNDTAPATTTTGYRAPELTRSLARYRSKAQAETVSISSGTELALRASSPVTNDSRETSPTATAPDGSNPAKKATRSPPQLPPTTSPATTTGNIITTVRHRQFIKKKQ